MGDTNRKYGPEFFKFSSLDAEKIPSSPPAEKIQLAGQISEEQRNKILKEIRVVPYIGDDLLEYSWRLVELSRQYEGKFREGKDVSVSCRSMSIGAITVACTAFEAYLNEEIFNVSSYANDIGLIGKARCFELAINLSPRDRIDTFFSVYENPIDWGKEPYQSLDLVLSIRKHLLHHEVRFYNAADGHWPARKLKDLKKRIGSPYPNNLVLDWDQHVLTPAGAEWVVRVLCDVIGRIEELWRNRRDILKADLSSDSA